MRSVLLLPILALAACGPGPEVGGHDAGTGQAAVTQADGVSGTGGAGTGISCTPGVAFCDGTKIWTCTRSGLDESFKEDCAWNAYRCVTSGCFSGQGACCRP